MPDDYVDPSGSTEQFRAFVNSDQAAAGAPSGSKTGLIIAGVVVVVAVVAVIAWLALG